MSETWDRHSAEGQTLVKGLREGDRDAFEAFVRAFAPRALRIAQRILKNEADAADAVQDAFISAMRSVATFRDDCQIATWFHRVATNAALMKLRSRLRKDTRNIDDLTPDFYSDGHRVGPKSAWADSPDRILEREEQCRMVREKISQLPEDFCNVLLLRDIQQETTAETARQLGISESAVKTRLHRARQALRSMIEEEFIIA